MKILAFEFSSARRSVAVVATLAGVATVVGHAAEVAAREGRCLGLAEEALRQAGVDRKDIDMIAVGLGPGSYAGIRVTLAVAQGWQLARPVPVLGVSSADCLAAMAQERGVRGRILCAVDAQRGEWAVADFELDASGWKATTAFRLLDTAGVAAAAAGATVIGPDAGRLVPGALEIFPDAGMTGCLAAGRSDHRPAPEWTPIYLREAVFVKAPPPRAIPPLS